MDLLEFISQMHRDAAAGRIQQSLVNVHGVSVETAAGREVSVTFWYAVPFGLVYCCLPLGTYTQEQARAGDDSAILRAYSRATDRVCINAQSLGLDTGRQPLPSQQEAA